MPTKTESKLPSKIMLSTAEAIFERIEQDNLTQEVLVELRNGDTVVLDDTTIPQLAFLLSRQNLSIKAYQNFLQILRLGASKSHMLTLCGVHDPVMSLLDQQNAPVDSSYPNISTLADSLTLCNHNDYLTREDLVYIFKSWGSGLFLRNKEEASSLFLMLTGNGSIGKTEFFRRLLPHPLGTSKYVLESCYRPDNVDYLINLSSHILAICDEISDPKLLSSDDSKRILTSATLSVRVPYDRKSVKLTRQASLCGTSNNKNVIQDNNNRRIIPIDIKAIDYNIYNSINKNSLFAEFYDVYKNIDTLPGATHPNKFCRTATGIDIFRKVNRVHKARSEAIQNAIMILCDAFSMPEGDDQRTNMTAVNISQYIASVYNEKIPPRSIGVAMKAIGFKVYSTRKNGESFKTYVVSKKS